MSERGDIIDQGNDRAAEFLADAIGHTQRAAEAIEKGEEGDCEWCGEWTSRLIGGACAPCRDKYRLP